MAESELNDWTRTEYKRSDFEELVRGKYAKLSKADREKVESEYHRMKPEDFGEAMSQSDMRPPLFRSQSASAKTEKRSAD